MFQNLIYAYVWVNFFPSIDDMIMIMMVVVVVLCFLLCFSFQDFYYEKRNNDNCQTGRSAKAVDV